MRYEITSTEFFDRWLARLKDRYAVKAVVLRLARVEAGSLGDVKPVGGPISEMRFFVGKGYRIYFVIQRERLFTLLCGGIKSSRKQQQQDISKAKRILDELEN
jgi:putative addiction module killer protein